MTLVAIHAVVDVTIHALVVLVGLRLLVAVGALEHRVVIWVRVTGGANAIRPAMICREVRVIESRSRPRGCRVASLASRRKARGRVVRVGRAVVIRRMAAITGRGQRGVVVVHVATVAGHCRVGAGQRERGVVVIEAGIRPRSRAMASVACGREADLRMIRIVGVVVIRLVTSDARGVRAGQLVVSIHVALLTGECRMCAGQGPAGG